jgi:hypothetical protein
MSFTTLGYSIPDLTISGEAGPRAAWGGTINVTVTLQNLGASSTTEPVSQLPASQPQATGSLYNSTSSADAPNSTVEVLISPSSKSLRGAVTLGTFEANALTQNSFEQVSTMFTLPNRPRGFAGTSGTFYVWFLANSSSSFEEVSYANNLSQPVAVQLTHKPLPELRAIGLSVPSRLKPGDTINPIAVIENFGTADSGPVTVQLVESVTRVYDPLAVNPVIATGTVADIPGASSSPTRGNYRTVAQKILNPPANVVSIPLVASNSTTFPRLSSAPPGKYYLGLLVNYGSTTEMLSLPRNALQAIHIVGPPNNRLPDASGVSTANSGQFPTAPTGETIGIS